MPVEKLIEKADEIIISLENENDLDSSVQRYQELLKLNNIIEKNFKEILNLLVKKH